MKMQNLVRILMLLAILGIVMLPVAHLNSEVIEKNTETTKETENNSESAEDSKDVEVNVVTEVEFEKSEPLTMLKETSEQLSKVIKDLEELNSDGILNKDQIDVDALLKKIKEQLNSLKEIEGVKVEILEPTVLIDSSKESEELKELKEKLKKLIENSNLDSDEITKKLKQLVDNMKIVKAATADKDIVTVLQYGPHVTTKILKDTKGIKELIDKMKELTSDEDIDSDELVKKVQALVKGMKSVPFIVHDKDNVKVYTFGPNVTTKTLTNIKDYKELGEKISKLAKDDDLDSDELAKKVLDLIEAAIPHIDTDIIRGNVKVIPLHPSKSLKEVNDSNIEKLEKRIEKLETKIDMLIEKISELNPESSEDE